MTDMTYSWRDWEQDDGEKPGIYVISGYQFGVKIGITRSLKPRMTTLQAQIDKAVRLCFGGDVRQRRTLVVEHFETMDWQQAVLVEKTIHRALRRHELGDELFNIAPIQAIEAVRLATRSRDGKAEHRKLSGTSKAGKTWKNDAGMHQFSYGKWPVDLIDRIRIIGENYGSQSALARDALAAGLEDVRQGATVSCGIYRDGKRFGFWIPVSLMNEMRSAVAPPVTLAGFGVWSLSRMCDRLEAKGQ